MQVIKNNVSLEATPTSDTHIVNKGYVDGKTLTINWADYQALSEAEKNNGTVYYIPDMPVSTSGEIIGDVEYGSFFGNDISGDLLSVDSVIDFSNKTRGNLTYDNGVKLTKGKLYLINCNVASTSSTTNSTNSHIRFDIRINGNQIYVTNGISIPTDSTSKWSNAELVTHYECKNDGEILTVNVVSAENINTVIGGMSHLIITEIPSIQACIDVTDEHIKEVATSLNCSWHTKDISLSTNLTEWGNESITVPEIINSKKVMLYDGTNEVWTSIFENIGEVMKVIYTNGLGVTDAYNFSQQIHIDFTNGKVMNISMRKLTSTGNPPNFTKIAYYK